MKREEDDDIDREAPTDRQSGAFAMWHHRALDVAKRFESLHTIATKHPLRRDPELAELAVDPCLRARHLAERIARWRDPDADPEAIALERPLLVADVERLEREADELVARLPNPPRSIP